MLIVDDNADAATALSMLLSARGHETSVAYSGNEALASVQLFRPEIALLDIGLPEMNGYELAKRLCAIPQVGDVRLIALTGYVQAEDRERSSASGFDAHLVKPVELPTLEHTLERIWRARGSTQ